MNKPKSKTTKKSSKIQVITHKVKREFDESAHINIYKIGTKDNPVTQEEIDAFTKALTETIEEGGGSIVSHLPITVDHVWL